MSSDRQILAGLNLKIDQEIRYFEVVQIAFGPEKKKCFLCIGKHSMIFMRQDLNQKINRDGEIMYAHILKVILDKCSPMHFLLMLNENANFKSDKISIKSESRQALLKNFQTCWQTDCMWRLNKVATFPLAVHPLTKPSSADPEVEAFRGNTWTTHLGYKFMLPDSFVEQPNAKQTSQTGKFLCAQTGVSLLLEVHEQMTMEELTAIHRDHIRWVALEYKAQLVRDEPHFYLLRSQHRLKRMNLVRDSAAWYSWELIIRTRAFTIVCLLLRRQYIPPLCDCAQDIAITIHCPVDYWTQYEMQVLLSARVIADSVSPVSDTSIYRELVQAKLDGLRFDEDGIEWVRNHQKMHTKWRDEAKRFLRTILNIFIQGRSQAFPADMLRDRKYLVSATQGEEWEEIELIDNLDDYFERMREAGDGLDWSGDIEVMLRVKNRWLARLARYFAWAVDGGLLGHHFTLEAMIEQMPTLEDDTQVKHALMFMLHVRNTTPPYSWKRQDLEKLLQEQRETQENEILAFNDRVMQQIISAEYLRKIYGRQKDSEYFKCLAFILGSAAGTNLKAYICRLFMEMRVGAVGAGDRTDKDANVVAVPALLHLVQSGGVYLATFASAALVNLSHSNVAVKMQLMSHGLAPIAIQNIKSKDDDLICYTLTLLVNLTKEAHHRYIMVNAGILPLLYDNLTSSYHQCRHAKGRGGLSNALMYNPLKEKILGYLCSLVGHFCKDEEYRDLLIDKFPHTVKCCIYICTHCVPGTQLASKVLYALKQLCAARNEQKQLIGVSIIKPVLEQISDAHVLHSCTHEYLNHLLLLLQMLSTYKVNCLLLDDADAEHILPNLKKLPVAKQIDGFEQMIDRVMERVKEEVDKMFTTQA